MITAYIRCCPSHLNNDLIELNAVEITSMTVKDHTFTNKASVTEVINKTRQIPRKSTNQKPLFDDSDSYSDEDLI